MAIKSNAGEAIDEIFLPSRVIVNLEGSSNIFLRLLMKIPAPCQRFYESAKVNGPFNWCRKRKKSVVKMRNRW